MSQISQICLIYLMVKFTSASDKTCKDNLKIAYLCEVQKSEVFSNSIFFFKVKHLKERLQQNEKCIAS